MALEALGADFFHHALHGRVDRTDPEVLRGQIGRENAVAGAGDRGHHAVRADGDEPLSLGERDRRFPEGSRRVRHHRLDDVAHEGEVLRSTGCDRLPQIDRPDHLIGRVFDRLLHEDVFFAAVAGEIDHHRTLIAQGFADREEHRIPETAAGQKHCFADGRFAGRAGGAHDDDRLARR